jgi:hypothetical protein
LATTNKKVSRDRPNPVQSFFKKKYIFHFPDFLQKGIFGGPVRDREHSRHRRGGRIVWTCPTFRVERWAVFVRWGRDNTYIYVKCGMSRKESFYLGL